MAEAMVQRSCAKLRSAIGDGAAKRWNLAVGDLEDTVKALEGIQAAVKDAEMRSLPLWLARVKDELARGVRDELVDDLEFEYDISAQMSVDPFHLDGEAAMTRSAWVACGWLKRVRKACYDITDMVNDLQGTTTTTAAGKISSRTLSGLAHKKNHMANKVKDIKEKLGKIQEDLCHSNFMPSKGLESMVQRIITPWAEEGDAGEEVILGRNGCVKRIMAAISCATASIIVIPVVGLHGIGKTTLARMVFKHSHFIMEYDFRIWVHVSTKFDLRRIAESIISQTSKGGGPSCHDNDGGKMEEEEIAKSLYGLFAGKKVLIILDDIWEQDPIQLGNLKQILTIAGAGSSKTVVIATTSIGRIGREICTGVPSPYYPQTLTDKMCWTIIKRSSGFEARPESERQILEQIGPDIATGCQGLPAVAREAGRALRGIDAMQWLQRMELTTPEVYANLVWFMVLCYSSMPRSLKLCFTYCAMLFFRSGRCVTKDDMVHQWITLDLVQSSGGYSATHVAEDYIRRLSEMFFLRATKLPSAPACEKHDKGAVLFTMPDLARGFAKFLMLDEMIILDGKSWNNKEEYCRYAVFTDTAEKTSSVLPSQLRALRCIGCSKMELNDDSFSFARCLCVLELKESSMQKLPDSICELRHLGYLNLSGCSHLLTLPESFGYLENLLYIDLSGSSGLVKLPQSFGKLINLMHVTFSGCSRLANLTESFGDLTTLLHVDLSHCYGLVNLPKSFQNLTSLMHLDLSFCSCFQEIQTVLGGLTSLQHLNLSHPCCYLAQHRSHLQGLEDVIGKLTKLKYLNLSMFLNPIFYYQSKNENHKYIELCMSGLPRSLEHLDLSHNIFLPSLPESPGNLSNLHTLDLSGCIRLKKIYRWMGGIECLKLNKCRGLESCIFVVHADNNSSSVVQLEHVNCQELEIRCVEKVKCTEEAQVIRLAKKQRVELLKLCWTTGSQRSVEDNALFEELKPPHSLRRLEIHGYNSETCLPSWWTTSASHLVFLADVTMEDFPRCRSIPPLGLLPNLQKVILRRMAGITRIDVGELSGGNTTPFSRLTRFTIDNMSNLEEFNASAYSSGDQEIIIFPFIDELVMKSCPKLSFGPNPPRAQKLLVSACDQVMTSADMEGLPSTCSNSTIQRQTELIVEDCQLPLHYWSLLRRLHGPHTLSIINCYRLRKISSEIIRALSSLKTLCFSQCGGATVLPDDLGELTSLQELQIMSCKLFDCFPESMKQLTSLQSMQVSDCKKLRQLPKWLGDLTSLQKLAIDRCAAIESLPKSIQELTNLKYLHISGCQSLQQWCESDGNKQMLAHIPNKKYE